MKPKKPEKKTTWHNKLDKVTSKIIRSIGHCERCGLMDYPLLQPSHIFSRSNFSVRWDFENILCLCASCHFWWHKNPTLTLELVYRVIGKARYNKMMSRAIGENKKIWSLQELKNLYKSYVGILLTTEIGDYASVATKLRRFVCVDLAKDTDITIWKN